MYRQNIIIESFVKIIQFNCEFIYKSVFGFEIAKRIKRITLKKQIMIGQIYD